MQKELVTVRILEGGKTCKEVNSFGNHFNYKETLKELDDYELANEAQLEWSKAESKLRTFEIVNIGEIYNGGVDIFYPSKPYIRFVSFGSSRQASILENGKAVIV